MTPAPKILVVDDSEAARFVKVQTLRRAGFVVVETGTGREALVLTDREDPEVIVLDVNLPDMSGLEVARRLRDAEKGLPGIQILQISSTAVTPADRVRGLEHGADVYLTEPVEGEVLVATVLALLRVRRAEAALAEALDSERQARALAEEANRLKDEFIATLSHELRTPLNALMGWVWQLRHRPLEPEAQARALDSLERNARIQAQLINDLLDISRASKGKLPLAVRVIDLEEVVVTAIESVREAAERKQIDVGRELAQVFVAGDHARLQQVVTNLLTNAVQFTPEQGHVAVKASAEGEEAVLSVSDTGSGIDPAFLPYVFDQFRQGEGGLSRKHGGLGLGLSVVRQLVDLHGGSVTVTSPGAGQGATFTVRLPREITRPKAVGPDSPLLLEQLKVQLVVGPNADSDAIAGVLESSGAAVTVVPHGAPEAADTAGRGAIDLILTDAGGSAPLRFRRPGADEGWQSVSKFAPPGEIVRRIAHFLAQDTSSVPVSNPATSH